MLKFTLNAPLDHLRRMDMSNVVKILRVLEYVCHAEKNFSIVDIAKDLGVNKSLIGKWLEAFIESGYIKQDKETDRYYPTLQIVTLGNCIMNKMGIRKLASAEIKQLCFSSGESAHLSMCDNNQTVIIDKIVSKTDDTGSFHIGRRSDLYSTGTGKIFLAFFSLRELERYLEETNIVSHTSMTVVDSKQIKRSLVEVRKNGYAIDKQENTSGISCIAGPIRDCSGKVIAAVSVTGPSVHIEDDIPRLSQMILEYSAKISQKLGYNTKNPPTEPSGFETTD